MTTLYAPVTMAIAGLPMNGALLPVEEFKPRSWIGRPVTLGHPRRNGAFVTAEEADAVGTIANAWVQDGQLKATLILDSTLLPSRVKRLIETDAPLDVSTGFIARDEQADGYLINRDVQPDHLALLPDEEGACSWQDGCGLRAQGQLISSQEISSRNSRSHQHRAPARHAKGNKRSTTSMTQLAHDIAAAIKANCIPDCDCEPEIPPDAHWVNAYLRDHALLNAKADGDEPAIATMTAHLQVREALTARHIADRQVARSRARKTDKDSPYTPEDGRLVDPEIAAMTHHEQLRRSR